MKRLPIFLLPLVFLVLLASPATAQGDLSAALQGRRGAIPDDPRAFQETWLVPSEGKVAPGPEQTEFGGRVRVYQERPRERIEIFEVEGGELGDPVVVVGDGERYWLVTPVGATPLLETEPAADPFVRMVLAGPAGEAEPHRTVPAEGGIAAVVLRHSLAGEFDDEEAFALELPRGGSGVLETTVSSFSAAGDPEVVASAGARGVDRVRTASGTITVTPDAEAVAWMEEELAVPTLELERFRREARLAPYDVLPAVEEAPSDPEAGR